MSNDKIIQKLLEHDEKLANIEKNMFTKADARELFDVLDKHMAILNRLDQERVFSSEWVKRVENSIEEQQKEIIKIKQVLKIG